MRHVFLTLFTVSAWISMSCLAAHAEQPGADPQPVIFRTVIGQSLRASVDLGKHWIDPILPAGMMPGTLKFQADENGRILCLAFTREKGSARCGRYTFYQWIPCEQKFVPAGEPLVVKDDSILHVFTSRGSIFRVRIQDPEIPEPTAEELPEDQRTRFDQDNLRMWLGLSCVTYESPDWGATWRRIDEISTPRPEPEVNKTIKRCGTYDIELGMKRKARAADWLSTHVQPRSITIDERIEISPFDSKTILSLLYVDTVTGKSYGTLLYTTDKGDTFTQLAEWEWEERHRHFLARVWDTPAGLIGILTRYGVDERGYRAYSQASVDFGMTWFDSPENSNGESYHVPQAKPWPYSPGIVTPPMKPTQPHRK